VARRQLPSTYVTYNGPPYPTTVVYNTNGFNGTDVYTQYTGDGSSANGWPDVSRWNSWDYLWNANLPLMANSCTNIGAVDQANNHPNETATVSEMIRVIANSSNVDPRFIFVIMIQESNGCVRV
jgi:hypothetical protein